MTKKEKINNSEIEELSDAPECSFPKYESMLINQVNHVAKGTSPKRVGQMSKLSQEFTGNSVDEWRIWYDERYPNAVRDSTDRIFSQYEKMKSVFDSIKREDIEKWVEDLIYTKTFCGLKMQKAIIRFLAGKLHLEWRLAGKEDESKGIDGYIGNQPVQIKPVTYKSKKGMFDTIDAPIVYYEKKKGKFEIEYDPADFILLRGEGRPVIPEPSAFVEA